MSTTDETPQDPLLEKIIKTIAVHYEMKEMVTPDTVLESLHLDPLDSEELIIEIEEETDIEVDEADYDNARTVHDLYLALKEKETA